MQRREAFAVAGSLVVTGWALLGTPRTCPPGTVAAIDAHYSAVGDCGRSGPLDIHADAHPGCTAAPVVVTGAEQLGVPASSNGLGMSGATMNSGGWGLQGPVKSPDGGFHMLSGSVAQGECTTAMSDGGLLLSCGEEMERLDADGGIVLGFVTFQRTCVFTLTP